MKLHHVGIVCRDSSLLERLLRLAATAGREPEFRHVPEFQCDCYLAGQIELVVPQGPHKDGMPLQRWLDARGPSLHHIAFEVDDVESQALRLREAGVPVVLDAPVDGVAGMRVNFVHPSYCGFLVEIVDTARAGAAEAA
jgi:methylmalonyl-CoA/ethylmalonyl-CoA epimerase